ncbi:DUF4147 domain-containing protein [Candidatus Woesearchaeota archaeon]|nr:DUF4147 domain-containing protein [Candidatus Woesearchaeota archaeon]
MEIKNKFALGTNKLRKDALDIVEFGINSVLPSNLIKKSLKYNSGVVEIEGDSFECERIFVVGAGKASGLMAVEVEKILPVEYGFVNCKDDRYITSKIKVVRAGHPYPDVYSINGVTEMIGINTKYHLTSKDLVLCLISGGASSLMVYPKAGISFEDLSKTYEILVKSGMTINEMNIVRKHISKIKGGKFPSYFGDSQFVSLILSDVIGDDISMIGSGLTAVDKTRPDDALNILIRYDIQKEIPKSVLNVLREPFYENVCDVKNYIIGNNKLALLSMFEKAAVLGYKPIVLNSKVIGDAQKTAEEISEEILNVEHYGKNAFILGGETTLRVPKDSGKGGRNQHFALTTLHALRNYNREWCCVAIGSDGSDYLNEYAGAIVDYTIVPSLKNAKEYLDNYDSNTLLKELGNSLIITGPTGTNVCDLFLYILK